MFLIDEIFTADPYFPITLVTYNIYINITHLHEVSTLLSARGILQLRKLCHLTPTGLGMSSSKEKQTFNLFFFSQETGQASDDL